MKNLSAHFYSKELRDLHYFLGIEVYKSSNGLLLTQTKYATDLLANVGIKECTTVSYTTLHYI
jgi:hypothetical protein